MIDLDLAVSPGCQVVRVEREQQDREDARDEPAESVDRRVAGEPPDLEREAHHPEGTVEVEQAVGDPVDVVDLLDVGAARGAELAPSRRLLDQRPQSLDERLGGRGHDGTRMPKPLALRSTTSGFRYVTTGLPSAIASSAKMPCQPAFSWSTTMSARA